MNRRKKFNIGIVAAIGGIFLTAMTAVGCNSSIGSSNGNPKNECPKAGELAVYNQYTWDSDTAINEWLEAHPDTKIYSIDAFCINYNIYITIIYYK